MSRSEKFLRRILNGQADADIAFDELCSLLKRLKFEERIRGDHHIFSLKGIEEIINLQPVQSKAKPYQVKQVRNLIHKYHLAEERKK
jgi:hypothetical protein